MNTSSLVQKVWNICHTLRDDEVGYGDHAGSGLPKIYRNWEGQHWRPPQLYELPEPEQTLMELRMSSLVPGAAIEALSDRFGARFTALGETARIALITAQVEGLVNHDRLKQITTEHPADLTKLLSPLVRDAFLQPYGAGKGTVYFLPGQVAGIGAAFQGGEAEIGALALIPETGLDSPELVAIPPELVIYQDLASVPTRLREELARLAEAIAHKPRVKPELTRETVLRMCKGRFLGLRVLADLLKRNPDDLRKRILAPLVKAGVLRAAYPSPSDPRQAYTSG